MSYLPGSNESHRDLFYDDDYRAYLITRSASEYRFARSHGKRVRVRLRSALKRANGFLKSLIEAIAESKMRRVQRELWLRGIRYDQPNDTSVTPAIEPTRRSR